MSDNVFRIIVVVLLVLILLTTLANLVVDMRSNINSRFHDYPMGPGTFHNWDNYGPGNRIQPDRNQPGSFLPEAAPLSWLQQPSAAAI